MSTAVSRRRPACELDRRWLELHGQKVLDEECPHGDGRSSESWACNQPGRLFLSPLQLREHALQLRQPEAAASIETLRRRIELGREKLRAAEEAGRELKPIRHKLLSLEADLAEIERRSEVPSQVLERLADALHGFEHRVMPGSRVRLIMPDALNVEIELDGVPF